MTDSLPSRFPRRIHLSVPHAEGKERDYVTQAFDSNWLSTVGPNLNALEKEFSQHIGLPAVALSSGTAALHLGLKLLGVKQGDEVVVPTLTFAASCNPALYEGAVPVFIDSERTTWNLDPNLLADFLRQRAAAKRLPKAVIVVHLFGQSADLDSIVKLCRDYGVGLLEDAAESLGARYQGRHPGTFGDVAIFSFNGNKIITGTSGGMLVSSRAEWVEKARYWSTQARDPDPLGIGNYVHSEAGYNYRLSNVLAGIVRGQLENLDERVRQRRAVFARYERAFADLPGIEPQPEADFGAGPSDAATGGSAPIPPRLPSLHTRWLSCFLLDKSKFGLSTADLIRFLEKANVESRPVWKPMHTQPLYRDHERLGGAVAEDLNERGICLPSSSSLSEQEQLFVISLVREAHRRAVQV